MTFHSWRYVRERHWVCKLCNRTTTNPTEGNAAKATCPGKKS